MQTRRWHKLLQPFYRNLVTCLQAACTIAARPFSPVDRWFERQTAWMIVSITGSAGIGLLILLQISNDPSADSTGKQPGSPAPRQDAVVSQPADDEPDPFAESFPGPQASTAGLNPTRDTEPAFENGNTVVRDVEAKSFEIEIQRLAGSPASRELDVDDEFAVSSKSTGFNMEVHGFVSPVPLASDGDRPWTPFQPQRLRAEPVPSTTDEKQFAAATAGTVVATAKLRLDVTAPENVRQGWDVPILFKITNIGSVEATNVVLHTDLPEELSYRKGRKLDLKLGTLAPGESRDARLTAVAEISGFAMYRSWLVTSETVSEKVSRIVEIVTDVVSQPKASP